MWSTIEDIRKYRWGRKYYLWVGIDMTRSECDITSNSIFQSLSLKL